MIRMLIVEDHAAIADALAALLASADDLQVDVVCRDKECAEAQLLTDPPDVVLCDVMLGGRDRGFELLRAFGADVAFVMYTAFEFPAYHAQAIEYGARGYVSKTAPIAEIQHAIRRAAAGKHAFPQRVLDSARAAATPPTARELFAIRLVADGATNDEIADGLGLRVKSVEGTLRRLFDRYGVNNRTQLVALATRQGWLSSSDGVTPAAPG
ncbi:MAG TPA: response regulator transcription factor [Candidatus Limnocylindrales bacterium]|nr:response regulator transcription factor [Candidatus Limnocylindrales bacterium]